MIKIKNFEKIYKGESDENPRKTRIKHHQPLWGKVGEKSSANAECGGFEVVLTR